jgi:hypothetical protein
VLSSGSLESLEPLDDLLYHRQFCVECGLLAPDVAGALGDWWAFTLLAPRDYPVPVLLLSRYDPSVQSWYRSHVLIPGFDQGVFNRTLGALDSTARPSLTSWFCALASLNHFGIWCRLESSVALGGKEELLWRSCWSGKELPLEAVPFFGPTPVWSGGCPLP